MVFKIEKSRNFKSPLSPPKYALFFITLAVIAYLSIIFIPYFYDKGNLNDFLEAQKNNALIIREYANIQINLELKNKINENTLTRQLSEKAQEENKQVPEEDNEGEKVDLDTFYKLFKGKKLISLDYVQQMNNASKLAKNESGFENLLWRSIAIGFGVILLLLLILKIDSHVFRLPGIALVFILSLTTIWFTGLPHVNKKFHIIIGVIYAIILAISDYLYTFNIDHSDEKSDSSGYLSSLQYKHRFLCVVFNAVLAIMLTIAGAFGFKTLDSFNVTFGESFVTRPLIGLITALTLMLMGFIIGILAPLRRLIADVENEMKMVKT